jgi:hypothetical protein
VAVGRAVRSDRRIHLVRDAVCGGEEGIDLRHLLSREQCCLGERGVERAGRAEGAQLNVRAEKGHEQAASGRDGRPREEGVTHALIVDEVEGQVHAWPPLEKVHAREEGDSESTDQRGERIAHDGHDCMDDAVAAPLPIPNQVPRRAERNGQRRRAKAEHRGR